MAHHVSLARGARANLVSCPPTQQDSIVSPDPKTGGTRAKDHCHAMQLDNGSPPCTARSIQEGTSTWRAISMAKTTSPPYCVVRFIERIDNSS